MKLIQSRDNPFFKQLVKFIDSARQRHKSQQTLLDGTHLLSAYLDAGKQPLHIILNAAALQDAEIISLLQRVGDTPITQLDDKLCAELSSVKTPTGLLSLIALPQSKLPKNQFVLLLENIQDPGNLGSIIRSAAAAGCDALYLSPECADVWSPKVLRAAMGGHFVLEIYEQQNLTDIAKQFDGNILASSLQASTRLYDCDLSGKLALLFGNEGAGLSPTLQQLANQNFIIPMPGKVESLNVAAAAAVCLFEAARQRHP
ncbi:MAG: RNA methyltransferase [Gallionella sp.]|nr:RNA methyltransferase [Gallionella sp.]